MAVTLPPDYESYFSQWEEKIGAFIEFDPRPFPPEAGSSGPPGPSNLAELPGSNLSGLPFAVKDNIAVRGFSLSCGSKLLKQLRAPYTASAVEKLRAAKPSQNSRNVMCHNFSMRMRRVHAAQKK
jgi:aspartyl-tRNA(Asn)/glutamyl-tRNA(Gln) amidotransferase subunit A